MTVFLTDVDDRPKINPVRQEFFGDARPASTLVEVSRLAVAGREGRDRGGRADPAMSDDRWNAFITRVEPGEPRSGPALRPHARGEGPLRHRRHPHDVRLRASTPSTCPSGTRVAVQRLLDAGAVLVGKTHLPEFAWSVLGAEPVVRHLRQPRSRPAGRRAARRAARPPRSRRPLRARARHRHRLLDPPPVRGLRGRRAEVAVGADLDGGRVPALPDARHGRADGAERRGRRADVVGADRSAGTGAAPLPGSRSGCSGSRRNRRRPRHRAQRPRRGVGRRTSSGSAHDVVEAGSRSRPRTRGRSSSTRPRSRTRRRSRAAPTSTAT